MNGDGMITREEWFGNRRAVDRLDRGGDGV